MIKFLFEKFIILGCQNELNMLTTKFNAQMDAVKATVSSKTAVPTAQVYPQFINLAHIWASFQDEMVLISVLSNILANLDQFATTHCNIFPDEVLLPYISNVVVKSDAQRLEETTGSDFHINSAKIFDNKMTVLYPESTKGFSSLPIYGKGFCPWTMHTFNGLMIPSNPANGVILYNDVYYAFSSAAAAYEFAADPDTYLNGVADVAKKSPELIQLLDLHKQFAAITPYSQSQDKGLIQAPVFKADMGTQTEVGV